MNRKHAWLLAVTCALAGAGTLPAQGPALAADPAVAEPLMATPASPAAPVLTAPPAALAPATPVATAATVDGSLATPTGGRLSAYLLGCRPGCCGPVGGNGPIGYELFLRWGINFPFGDHFISDVLDPGWIVHGGGRTYLFDQAGDAAWSLEVGISNIRNSGRNPNNVVQLIAQNPPGSPVLASVDSLNRTYVNFGLGREYWFHTALFPGLFGNGHVLGIERAVGRWGVDGGVRWGTARLEFDTAPGELPLPLSPPHNNDTILAAYAALHSDIEIPCGCCLFVVGGRFEWDYTWMNILPGSDLQAGKDTKLPSFNLLLNTGIRF